LLLTLFIHAQLLHIWTCGRIWDTILLKLECICFNGTIFCFVFPIQVHSNSAYLSTEKLHINLFYQSFGTIRFKMCQSLIVYIYMHSALTEVCLYLLHLARFLWGLPIVTIERDSTDARLLVTFFWGFILWQQGTSFLLMMQKRKHINTRQSDLYSGAKSHRTNQIASYSDALSFTYTYI
jgi:hypothetical protein